MLINVKNVLHHFRQIIFAMEPEKVFYHNKEQNCKKNTITMMDLNDDCLEAVFKQFEDKTNLHSLALTCTRFNAVAKMAFGRSFTTFQRVDERILNIFADQITSVTVKTGTKQNFMEFSEKDLRTTFNAIKEKCTSLKTFQIMLPNPYGDFINVPQFENNWYSKNYIDRLKGQYRAANMNNINLLVDIDIVREESINDFIKNFNDYLRQDWVT